MSNEIWVSPTEESSLSESPKLNLRGVLRTLVVDQYRALWTQYPADPDATEVDRLKVMGLYLLVAFCLISNNYFGTELFKVIPTGVLQGHEIRFARKVGWAWWVTFFYLVPTYAYCRFVLGLGLRDLGFRFRGFLQHVPLYIAFFLIVLPFVVWVSDDPHFLRTYPLAKYAGDSWLFIGIWEASYGFQFVGVEFFFRGVMLFGAVRLLGPWVIPMMVVPYVMLHFHKPWLEATGAIIAGTVLAVVALRTRSIFAGIAIHTAVAWTMDFLALWNKGALQKLLGWE